MVQRVEAAASRASNMEKVVTKYFHRHLSVYAAIIMMFTYNVLLDRDFSCSCRAQRLECSFYMVLPLLIIVVLILWTDRPLHSICRHVCRRRCWSWSFMPRVLKALLVGLLWVAFVLIDGDWYVCCRNNLSDLLVHLPCTDQTKITAEERVRIVELKNWSRVYGSVLLLAIVLIAALMSVFEWERCCNTQPLFQRLILEAKRNKLEEVLRKAAEEKLTEKVIEKIDDGPWDQVCDVVETLIEESQQGRDLGGRENRRRAAEHQEEELKLAQRPE
ncbi:uncharacterized protein LOC118471641 isoform X2 [Amphiprion ocellaris]|uniref:uncharacterized protein LOC118471641 isoform X2 n=1 Tax=Amphiprion ocellaris TaxID=80972 RepID=UPI002410EC33|nr:uncharacterized protein LOC118471641 isoform X2 [Amphiprion ocellaris]